MISCSAEVEFPVVEIFLFLIFDNVGTDQTNGGGYGVGVIMYEQFKKTLCCYTTTYDV